MGAQELREGIAGAPTAVADDLAQVRVAPPSTRR